MVNPGGGAMRLMISLLLVSTAAGCFTTRVESEAVALNRNYAYGDEIRNREIVHEARQYFSVGGLVPVSKPAGRHCKHGLSYVESEARAVDYLISVGMFVVGVVAAIHGCRFVDAIFDISPYTGAWCLAIVNGSVASALSSRTTRYACAEAPEDSSTQRQDGDRPHAQGSDWWY